MLMIGYLWVCSIIAYKMSVGLIRNNGSNINVQEKLHQHFEKDEKMEVLLLSLKMYPFT